MECQFHLHTGSFNLIIRIADKIDMHPVYEKYIYMYIYNVIVEEIPNNSI